MDSAVSSPAPMIVKQEVLTRERLPFAKARITSIDVVRARREFILVLL